MSSADHNPWGLPTVKPEERTVELTGTFQNIDKLKRAEEALRETEERLRQLAETMLDAVLVGQEGRNVYANAAAARLLRAAGPEELVGLEVFAVIEPTRHEWTRQHMERVLAGERQPRFEDRFVRLDGSSVQVEIAVSLLMWQGRPALQVVVRDITERKRAEQGLHESEERYRSLIEAAPDVIYTVFAEDGSLTSLNPAFERLTGWSRAEWLGKPFAGMVHPDDLPVALERFQKALRGETQPPRELRVLCKSGEYMVGEFTSTSHVRDGKVVGQLGIARDITERRRAEEALRESEERFRAIVENAPFGYYRVGKDGLWQYVSPVWERMHGLSSEEIIGKPFEVTQPPDSVGEARELVKRALAGETIVGEFGRLRREGKIEYHSFNIQPVKHCTGIVGIEGFINDITERKRAEEALRASEEKHRTLFETMAQGVVYQNAEGHIISANPAAERLLGLTLAQMLGRTSMDPRWQAIHEDGSDFPGDTHPCMIALKTGKEVSHVVMGVFHPGANEYVWINIHAVPQFRPGETKPYQVYTTFDDITGRKRAEEALRRSRENFEALAESASEGILIATGEEGRNVYANRRAVEITGYPIEELLKTCMRDLAHPEELPKIAERYKERLEGLEVPNHYETAFLNKDGVKVPIEISPSRTIWQNQLADMVMFRDITERKRAEEAVRRASAYNRSLIEASLDPLVTIAPDGKITDVNNATEKATGLPRQQLIGTDFSDYFTDPEKARAGYEQVFREGLVQDYELEIRHRDGHATPVLYKASVYRGETGDVIGVFAAARDITARKRTEEALRQLSGRLLRSQDEERRRIARQLHETTAQGLAGLAVNLTIVKSSAADLSPRASACLSESLELAEQCSREIRTLSYLLHPPLVDEAGLAPALRWYTAGFAQRSGIEVHVDVSPEFGRLPSEVELTLYRIVQEALTNIHLHSGSQTARICLERRPNEIVLTVADEGHGFPSAALGIAGPESADIGVGILGMQERVRQLGGRLHIQSDSRGTTLTAYLPLSEVTHGETAHPARG